MFDVSNMLFAVSLHFESHSVSISFAIANSDCSWWKIPIVRGYFNGKTLWFLLNIEWSKNWHTQMPAANVLFTLFSDAKLPKNLTFEVVCAQCASAQVCFVCLCDWHKRFCTFHIFLLCFSCRINLDTRAKNRKYHKTKANHEVNNSSKPVCVQELQPQALSAFGFRKPWKTPETPHNENMIEPFQWGFPR